MQKLHYRPASEGSGRSPKICNSSVDESVYIKMIRQERPLWDKKHRDYKNLEVKNKIWKEIAEKCGSTGNIEQSMEFHWVKENLAQIRMGWWCCCCCWFHSIQMYILTYIEFGAHLVCVDVWVLVRVYVWGIKHLDWVMKIVYALKNILTKYVNGIFSSIFVFSFWSYSCEHVCVRVCTYEKVYMFWL